MCIVFGLITVMSWDLSIYYIYNMYMPVYIEAPYLDGGIWTVECRPVAWNYTRLYHTPITRKPKSYQVAETSSL